MTATRAAHALAAALAVGAALAAAAGADTWVQDTWRQTTYYRVTFTAEAGSGTLRVAAADSYQVFLNGTRVGGDSTATRLAQVPVQLSGGSNELAVAVTNRGRGAGNGLLALLQTDSLRVVTTTDRSLYAWRWADTVATGTGWRTAATDSWTPVQNGEIDTSQVGADLGPDVEVIAGYAGGVDIGGADGGVTLKGIQGENLALDMPANRVETVDGDLLTAWEPPVAALNFTASVDLRDRYLVRKVRVLTKGPGYEASSLRGYSVQVSDDQVRWSEVTSVHDITDYERTEVDFTPTWTRYVRIVVVQINAVTQPKVAEIEVYGDGYAEAGRYLSPVLALGGSQARKNFGRVDWEADVPERTELSVQFRTADQAADLADPEAGWSAPLTAGDLWFPADEPGRLLQYRVNMETRDERRTPVFRRLGLDYSEQDLPASGATAWVRPTQVPMGQDTTFDVHVDLSVGSGDAGVERLQIQVPAEAVLDPAAITGTTVPVASWSSSQELLTLIFARPLTASAQLRIPLRTRTYSNLHAFRTFLFSPGSDNPLNATQGVNPDPQTGQPRSWELLATTAGNAVLGQVRAVPAVVTPNGDDINDDTVIEFVLSRVDVPRPVRIEIADLSGRIVRDLGRQLLSSGSYQRPRHAATGDVSPGRWDGTDASGQLVPPGLYFYRVAVELDGGDEVRVGVVGVAY